MGLLAHRPGVVAFDVIETLFALEERLRPRLEEAGLPGNALEWWLARTLRDGFALAASGDFQPFARVAETALAAVAHTKGIQPSAESLEAVRGGFSDLEPCADAEPALAAVVGAGLPVLAVTNGSAETTKALLSKAALDGYVDRVVSVDDVGHWKPRAEVYLHAAEVAGVSPGELALVAVHAWDVHGASRAGLVTGWASRLEGSFPATFDFPHVHGQSLVEVVDGLLGLPRQ
ncbi:MAG: haloacid dehalogenase type II [Acidimicrobiales bacterium]